MKNPPSCSSAFIVSNSSTPKKRSFLWFFATNTTNTTVVLLLVGLLLLTFQVTTVVSAITSEATSSLPSTTTLYDDGVDITSLPNNADNAFLTINAITSNNTSEHSEGPLYWYDYVINSLVSVVLICGAGMMSGLTLGLLSLDSMSLEILKTTGTEREKKYAKRLAPLVKRHHLLLVTLVLFNSLCVEALPLFLDKLVPEWVAIILGVTFILLFGEVIPQAVIARYGLTIGGNLWWLVWILLVIGFLPAYPVSKLLDFILGTNHGTLFKRTELKELVNLHFKAEDANFRLLEHEVKILGGALEFRDKTVDKVMTGIDKVYMLDYHSTKLDMDTMTSIWQIGHSRIPVYKDNRNNIVGILHVKDLILINPQEELPLSTVISFYGRQVQKVFPDLPLHEMLKQFITGTSHLAVIHEPFEPLDGGDPFYKIIGIVTLEDVIEEIIKDEIIDETEKRKEHDENMLKSFRKDNSNQNTCRLPIKQLIVITSYLMKTLNTFKLLSEEQLLQLLSKSVSKEYKSNATSPNLIGHQENRVQLYEKGKEYDYFTLVLNGRVEVLIGEDKFKTEFGPWSFLGERALTRPEFIPDFDAFIDITTRDCTILKIHKKDFIDILSEVQKKEGNHFFLPKDMEWMYKEIKERQEEEKNNHSVKVIPKGSTPVIATIHPTNVYGSSGTSSGGNMVVNSENIAPLNTSPILEIEEEDEIKDYNRDKLLKFKHDDHIL
ncbi:hypothetical protein ABK040_001345 [Willaertia magna]